MTLNHRQSFLNSFGADLNLTFRQKKYYAAAASV